MTDKIHLEIAIAVRVVEPRTETFIERKTTLTTHQCSDAERDTMCGAVALALREASNGVLDQLGQRFPKTAHPRGSEREHQI